MMSGPLLDEQKDELRKRLRRMEGQVRGVSKMLDEERSCQDIVQQLSAIRAAAHQASLLVIRAYAQECLIRPDTSQPAGATIDNLIQVLSKSI
jgi:DNA-binding FrmR family transcriptional regulator